jgi:general secretion pathway protein F
MPRFHFKALAADGRPIAGNIEAGSLAAAIEGVQAQGHFPLSALEAPSGGLRQLLNTDLSWRRSVSQHELSIAIQELASLLEAGLPLDRSLEILVEVTPGRTLKAALETSLARVRDGDALADALDAPRSVFPAMAIDLVRAGELGGYLDKALLQLADYFAKAHALRETIKSALVYPIMLLVTGAAALVVMLTYVLPSFKPLFADAGKELPLSTQIVMGAGDFVGAYGWLMLLAMVAVVAATRQALQRPELRRRYDDALLRLPVFGGLLTRIEAARFSRTLGTLLGNGVTLPSALAITAGTLGNSAVAAAVGTTSQSVREGEGLGELLARARLFPSLALHLVRVGEETGQLDAMLLRQAEIYDREVQRTVGRLLAALVPALTLALGGIVAGIVASILTAILKLNELAA